MQEKTIGSFISALRKAKGMTQQELADRLAVSNKAVSRWERDECYPDIALIPVIAEIFDITADELLRGERQPLLQQPAKPPAKQIKRLTEAAVTAFSVQGMGAVAIAAVGLIVAILFNFAFHWAVVGFCLSLVFYLGATVMLLICGRLAFSALQGEEEAVSTARRQVFGKVYGYLAAVAVLLCVTLPLAVFAMEAYVGLLLETWLFYGGIFGVLLAALAWLLASPVRCLAAGSGLIILCDTEEAIRRQKKKTALSYTGLLALLVTVTVFAQVIFNGLCPSSTFARGQEIVGFEAFKMRMEKQTYFEEDLDSDYESTDTDLNITISEDGDVWFDRQTVYRADGKTPLGSFLWRNESVTEWSVDWVDDKPLFTVYTHVDLMKGNNIRTAINWAWGLLYMGDGVTVYLLYRKKRKAENIA